MGNAAAIHPNDARLKGFAGIELPRHAARLGVDHRDLAGRVAHSHDAAAGDAADDVGGPSEGPGELPALGTESHDEAVRRPVAPQSDVSTFWICWRVHRGECDRERQR